MANYIATTEQFTATANAIRAKTGASGTLEWDASTGYADDIAAIPAGIDTSDATAGAGDILSGKTAYVNGSKVTGNIATKTASDLSASGKTVTVPAGYYASQVTKDVATGSATAPASISGSSATVSTGTNTLTLTKTVSVTPNVSAGYVASGTAGNSSVSLTAAVTTKAAATITPGTTNQTIAAGTYLTGAQTIAGDADLVAGNIKKDVTIFGVTGTLAGSGDAYAAISVAYPAGSVCTATNGTTTLTAADASGQVVFGIPEPSSTPETWTVSCTDGTESKSIIVNIAAYGQTEVIVLSYIPAILNDATWEQISTVAANGTGELIWDIGDCKEIHIQGNIGTLSLNTTLCVFILDFNYPDNTAPDNNIIFGGFKSATSNGVDVVLCDSKYNQAPGGETAYYSMCHRYASGAYGYNYGGWKACDLRYDVLGSASSHPSQYTTTSKTSSNVGYDATANTLNNPKSNTLLSAIPANLRNVLKLWKRYIDSKGNSSNIDANCSTATIDVFSLLSEYEVFGANSYANIYEKSHQRQMLYYSNGNSKSRYKHNNLSAAALWWLASPVRTNSTSFCFVTSAGTLSSYYARDVYGLAPAFKI